LALPATKAARYRKTRTTPARATTLLATLVAGFCTCSSSSSRNLHSASSARCARPSATPVRSGTLVEHLCGVFRSAHDQAQQQGRARRINLRQQQASLRAPITMDGWFRGWSRTARATAAAARERGQKSRPARARPRPVRVAAG
jgi:hypothetical protein